MDLKEVQEYLAANKDNEEVKSYTGGFVSPDRVTAYLDSEDGKKLLQPKLDSYHSKGLDSWKANNLNKMVDEEVKKRFPEADPKDIELNKLKAEFEAMKKESTRKELTNTALKTAQEKKLPVDLIDYFIGQDADSTTKNLEKLIATMAAHDEAIKLEFSKANSYTPPASQGNVSDADKLRAEVQKWMK